MSSKAVSDKIEPRPDDWRSAREIAPSLVRTEDPTVARWFGLIGLMCVTLGSVVLVAAALGKASWISPLAGFFFSIVGLALLLFHAFVDADLQVRRTYGILGYLWIGAGLLVTALPLNDQRAGAQFLPWGFTCLTLGWLFLLPYSRHETEENWRLPVLAVFGIGGVLLAATGFIGGNINDNFLQPHGLLLIVLGLAYLCSFIVTFGTSSDWGYRAALGLGAVGLLIFIVALIRSILPPLINKWHWTSTPMESYIVPGGFLLMILGLVYAGVAASLALDYRLVVLTRRELASFFYSPIAYIVLFGLTSIACLVFWQFVMFVFRQPEPGESNVQLEPVVRFYLIAWIPVLCLVFVVPALTMRLLSEENRTGTMEVLLTAPVSETEVVLSKFFSTWLFFILAWAPWGLFLISFRVEGGQPFEYRPLLSFFIALVFSGAGFIAMGLFFSSLTRNQIAAAILGFVGMIGLTSVYFVHGYLQQAKVDPNLVAILDHASYVSLWITSMDGKLAPRQLVFHSSAAVFWIFITIKMLESRKWR
jgi:ABC-type transport system involved in multi-copper enzyme maturation permease subunit